MTSDGLGNMFEGDFADMCPNFFVAHVDGVRAEDLACTGPGERTPIGEITAFLPIFFRNTNVFKNEMLRLQTALSQNNKCC